MTSQGSADVREVIFINERCRVDYEAMPAEVRESADQAIDALQTRDPCRLSCISRSTTRSQASMKSDFPMMTTPTGFT
jgi:hypothetical protein